MLRSRISCTLCPIIPLTPVDLLLALVLGDTFFRNRSILFPAFRNKAGGTEWLFVSNQTVQPPRRLVRRQAVYKQEHHLPPLGKKDLAIFCARPA